MIDGTIVTAISEERCTYRKNEMGFPRYAIAKCLDIAGIKASELDVVAFSSKSVPLHYLKFKREFSFTIRDWLNEQEQYWRPKLFGEQLNHDDYFNALSQEPRFNEESWYDFTDIPLIAGVEESKTILKKLREVAMANYFGVAPEALTCFDHHTCHAYYAYWASPYRDKPVLVFTADGGGDGCNATLSTVTDNRLQEISRNNVTDLARIYRYITLLLSMKIGEHEYKVMGLAPYASEYEISKTDKVFKDVFHVVDLMVEYKNRPKDLFFHFREELADCRFDGIAGGVQRMVEEVGMDWFSNVTKNLGISRVVFSGGLSMNVKLNQEIAKLDTVTELYIPASGGDESLCVGACYKAASENYNGYTVRHFRNNYVGGDVPRGILLKEMQKLRGIIITEQTHRVDVARLLAQGLVIGRFSGQMEFGARALGNRSILADPRNVETVEKINRQVKFRDFWMPFAPTILDSYVHRYLVNPKRTSSDHMTLTFDVTDEGRTALHAALHPADGTVRAQILDRENNEEYFLLIEEFAKLTGVGALLNTSFNLHGFPIVSEPEHLIHVFENSDLDAMILDDILVMRKRSS